MHIEFVPLLQIQRDLYGIPRGWERFKEYLHVMANESGDDLRLPPLVAMNPMGKDHVPALLDSFLALEAESVGARAAAEAETRLTEVPGEFKVGLVIADDAMGMWTNRYASEFSLRFPGPVSARAASAPRGAWLSGVLWTSEAPSVQAVREAVLMPLYRAAYMIRHGPARTLGELLAQEGQAMALAGCAGPRLEADDLAYTRAVIAPHLEARDTPTLMACLFGDAAARAGAPAARSERAGRAGPGSARGGQPHAETVDSVRPPGETSPQRTARPQERTSMKTKRRFSKKILAALHEGKIIGLRVGAAPHRFIGLWVVVVEGRAFIRSWSVEPEGWYHASLKEPHGVLQIGERQIRIRIARTRSERLNDAVDLAYREKYNTPFALKYVRDLKRAKSRATTTELVPA